MSIENYAALCRAANLQGKQPTLQNLTPAELDILAAATSGELYVFDVEQLPLGSLRATHTNFDVPGDPDYATRYMNAFRSLCRGGCVDHDGGVLFVLTPQAQELAGEHRRHRAEAGHLVDDLQAELLALITRKEHADLDLETTSQLFVRWKERAFGNLQALIGPLEAKKFGQLGSLRAGIIPSRRPRTADDHFRRQFVPYLSFLVALQEQLAKAPAELLSNEYRARATSPAAHLQSGSVTVYVTGQNARANFNSVDASTNVVETDPDQLR